MKLITCILASLWMLIFSASGDLFSNVTPDENSDISITQIQRNEKIKILEARKRCDTSSAFWGRYAIKSTEWKLDSTEIIQILNLRKKEEAFEIHNHYNVLPCYYEGYILLNNVKYFFTINAGSFVILSKGKKDLYFSCTNREIAKYFITSRFEN